MENRIARHAAFWIAYLLLNVRLMAFGPKADFWTLLAGESTTLIPKMSLTYFIFYWIIPDFIEKRSFLRLIASATAAFVASVLLYRWLIVAFVIPTLHPEELGKASFFNNSKLWWTAWDIFITVATASTIKLFRLFQRSAEHEKALTQEKTISELNFLRAQTNPHFLFNTLNNLYGLARRKDERAPEAILRLSNIMRFVLYDCRAPKIALADKARVIEEYIELEKLRFSDRLTVVCERELDDGTQPIAPLLLLPFVENAFKHCGQSTTGDAQIAVRLRLQNERLLFETENSLEPDAPRGPEGIGHQNVKRQLELVYAGRHELAIEPQADRFKISLKLDLREAAAAPPRRQTTV